MASKRSPSEIIAALRLHIQRIQTWVDGMDAQGFETDHRTRYACERAFIAIGEALNDLSAKVDLNQRVPGGPWADPVRFRHFLAHDYDDRAIPPVVWDTIQFDLPELEAALDRLTLSLTTNP
jgi:uncharacterized protein with HEPN domain